MNASRHILPGGYYFGRTDEVLATLLGSCVSVVLWHPQQRLVAITHFLLPRASHASANDTRAGEAVFDKLQDDMQRTLTHPSEYRMGVFGGASCINRGTAAEAQIGRMNIAFTRKRFAELGWRIHRENLGGAGYRRLTIDGRSGSLACIHLNNGINPTLRGTA